MDWSRVKRTAIQAAAGAGVTFLAAVTLPLNVDALIAAGVQFLVTTLTAVLMNIQKQAESE